MKVVPYGKCVRIRPTQRNLIRLNAKLQAMLGVRARSDDLQKKVAAVNRVLRGWANYYKAVNAYEQFEMGDSLARRLFQQWYCNKCQIRIRQFLSEVGAGRKVVVRKGQTTAELFQMTSIKSAHTALNHSLVWKYRHIGNPYINPDYLVTSISETSDTQLKP